MTKLAILLYLAAAVTIAAVMRERRDYNGGVCRHCKAKLRHFDNDSQGGRGYVCDRCGRTVWVSYPCVDKGGRNND